MGPYKNSLKRLLDIVLTLVALPIVLPLVVLLAITVSLGGGRPFYTQQRVGRDGALFTMWKLRSMLPDADDRLETYLDTDPAARAEWESKQKLVADPRTTPFGKMLRKSSLDELPQLWNVLKGDMSLVGPRPMMPTQLVLYPGEAYYHLRPGITGLWQISDRNESAFAERANFDTRYGDTLSFRTDLGILLATIGVVLRGTGH